MQRQHSQFGIFSYQQPTTSSSSNPLSSSSSITLESPILFLNQLPVSLNHGDRLRYASMDWMTNTSLHPKIVILHRNDLAYYKGVYTSGIQECMVVAAIEKDESNQIAQIAMLHAGGGINKRRLKIFLNEISGFSQNRELIFFFGESYRDYTSNSYTVENCLELLEGQRKHFKAIHVHKGASTCCVTFDGQIGIFDPYSQQALDHETLDVELNWRSVQHEYDQLMIEYSLDSLQINAMHMIKYVIEAQRLSESIKSQWLELTRFLFIKSLLSMPHSKEEAYDHYIHQMKSYFRERKIRNNICITLCALLITRVIFTTNEACDKTRFHTELTSLRRILQMNERTRGHQFFAMFNAEYRRTKTLRRTIERQQQASPNDIIALLSNHLNIRFPTEIGALSTKLCNRSPHPSDTKKRRL